MRKVICSAAVVLSLVGVRQPFAQSLPTSQPKYVQVIIEDVKVGHDDDHSKSEAGWGAAFEKAKYPYYNLGMVALTGSPQAWFMVPFESNQAYGESMKRSADDPVLSAELARLSRADAAHINSARTLMLAARKDLSHGAFPDLGKQRFYQVTLFRVRPGHESQFEAAAKAYGAAADRAAPDTPYRVYEVEEGMPGPAYMLMTSVAAFGDFDKMGSDGEQVMKGMNKDEMDVMQKFSTEALVNAEQHRFRIDPNMCYVPKEVRDSDPAFWNPKKPAAKATTPQQPQRDSSRQR